MVMLTRSLDKTAPHYPNYRGKSVYNGLGIVWFVWLLSQWAGGQIIVMSGLHSPDWIVYLMPIFALIAGACIFGLYDDWVGCSSAKGFRGHIGSLFRGILTTGGVKMLAIGFLALFTMILLYWNNEDTWTTIVIRIIAGTCVIALNANLLNLFDLRPGRAGKVYALGFVICMVVVILSSTVVLDWPDVVALALVGLGPLIAAWRYDIQEKGMLGDAGANSMGAFLGYLLATALPIVALVAWALALLPST